MKTIAFRQLATLRHKYGPGIFGKITQKLLALAFEEVGFRVVERGVQGADIEVERAGSGEKYVLEVKTTDAEAFPVSKRNIVALEERANDGYVPLIAALRMQLFEDWIIARIPRGQLRPGTLPLSKLRAYRMRELEGLICPRFEAVVNQQFSAVLSGGERHLIRILDGRKTASP